MSDLLYKGRNGDWLLRRRPEEIAGWPEVQREVTPTALDAEKRRARLYDATWREFRRGTGPARRLDAPRAAGWAADLRFRQKASLLRIAGTVDFADDLIDNGQQVAISVAFLETSALLTEKG